jgi:hypothetical protein
MTHHPENIARAQRIIDACKAVPESYYATLVQELETPGNTPGDIRDGLYDITVALLTDLRHLCHIRLPEGRFEEALTLSERHAIAETDSPE